MEFKISNPTNKSKTFCSVFGCNSKARRSPHLSFHHFPRPNRNFVVLENKRGLKEKVDVFTAWKNVLKFGKPVSPHMVVCSLHFKETDYFPHVDKAQRRRLKKSAVPSVNLPLTTHPLLKKKRKEPAERTTVIPECDHNVESSIEIPSTSTSSSTCCESSWSREDVEAANILCALASPALQVTQKDAGVQVNTTKMQTVCDNIETNQQLNTITGIRNFKLIEILECLVKKHSSEKRKRVLTLKERIVLTFMKLKHNCSYVVLSFLFGNVSSETCKNIFFEMLTVLSQVLRCAVPFLDRNVIISHMPKCFKNFPNVRIVLDCTEIAVQKSSCLCCQIKTYSHYKSTHTLKFMTGVSPSGLITFISRMYGGRVSDKVIFEQSGLINKLEKGEALMVDKGFLIDAICQKHGIELIRPPFLRNCNQLSHEEAQQNASIARARVHIERSNQRLKVFKILEKVQWNLVPKMEEIFTVICGVVNLSTPILSQDKF